MLLHSVLVLAFLRTPRRGKVIDAGTTLTRGGVVTEPRDESNELEEATREYVERLKRAYPGINEQDLYELVLQVARRRVEEAER